MNDDSFFSINRLVEFGMSMAVAQQMVQTMNHTLSSMQVPGTVHQPAAASAPFYYVMMEGKPAGPFSEQELSRLITAKQIIKETYIWKPGLAQWERAENLPEILKLVALTPPPFPSNS